MNEEQEFIVAYAPTWCNIASILVDDRMLKMYDYAVKRLHRSYGEVVGYNNQFWSSVIASNSKEAFDLFSIKFEEYQKRSINQCT